VLTYWSCSGGESITARWIRKERTRAGMRQSVQRKAIAARREAVVVGFVVGGGGGFCGGGWGGWGGGGV
jgi:hypothetical protein